MASTILDYLLELDGLHMNYEGAYWIKIEVRQVTPTLARPHGIRYSLSLHDGGNVRIMGFDNAHAVAVSKGFKGKRFSYDHVHRSADDQGTEYVFEGPEQLLSDFWDEVETTLTKVRGK